MKHDVPGYRSTFPRKIARFVRLTLWSLLLVAPALCDGAQDKKAEAQLRTVHGSIVDKDDNPVAASVVYLLNLRRQSIITRITDDTGAYRFSGLDPNVDYEIHAEHDDLTSATRTISSFDSRRDIEVILKLSHKKAAH
jgi:Carboxypeptidase regulatory-like domain